jgi:hypothetical protein
LGTTLAWTNLHEIFDEFPAVRQILIASTITGEAPPRTTWPTETKDEFEKLWSAYLTEYELQGVEYSISGRPFVPIRECDLVAYLNAHGSAGYQTTDPADLQQGNVVDTT